MPSSLGERVAAARRRQFVGRAHELEMFRSALATDELPFQVLFIFGPGGVGKTTLLGEFAHLSDEAQARSFYLDARNFEPSPESFIGALRHALNLDADEAPLQALARELPHQVILIDTSEILAPLDSWLRDVFMPQLPENTLVVLAGREPPATAWQADIGWQTLVRTLPLRNLNPDETRAYLSKRHVPADQHQQVLSFTHGYPLALSLVAEVFAQRKDLREFQLADEPDIVKTLLERFVQKVPGPAHRAALEACALARAMTEALLGEMLISGEGTHELFEWLRSLSFIETGREGLFPHDLAREALLADLRWRNPDWYKELHHRAREYYASRVQQTHGLEQQEILYDYVFLHRDNPVIRSMLEWQTGGAPVVPDVMREADRAACIAMVEKHEGAKSAQFAAKWLASQPEGATVYRDGDGQIAGFIAMVALQRASTDEIQADAATRLAWEYLQRHAPLRPGEIATHYRFWMACDTYQDVSSVQTLIFLNTVRYQLTTPGLAYHFLPCANPDMWAGAFAYANLMRLPETDYEVGGKHYGVYGHDWRAEPPLAWLQMLAEREVAGGPTAPPPAPPAPIIVLSETEFAEAVRAALRDFAQPDLLPANPLLRSRLVIDRAGLNSDLKQRVTILQAVLRAAAESLRSSPRDVKLYRALDHTYFRPAPTQEQAAELLDVPFSTYRRHLKSGIQRVTEMLWQAEIGETHE